jgi:hypothetical protein
MSLRVVQTDKDETHELGMISPFLIPSPDLWQDCIIYFGFPILSLEFAPR